ncbi:charged multivesicular body protein 7 [Euwallacea fornicatus]|uniref:charged multivesicular body protein 7 n=1 Tax=Euwallacea fornicatus TaxID=995702 RepID=UPI00338ED55D
MFGIAEDKLPDALKDESRLNVLFAPLRNKSVNSKDWQDKISTWKSIIKIYCEANNKFSFTLSSLNETFIRHGRSPPCLTEVLNDMIKNKEVEVVEVFLKKTAHTWSGWLTDIVIKKPLNWSYNAMKKTLFSSTNGNYIHLELVKKKSTELLSTIPDNYKNKVLSFKELLAILSNDKNVPSVENLKLLLHYLENQQKIAMKILANYNVNNEQDTLLLKIGDSLTVTPITDVDVGIHTLEQNEKVISKHVENLEDQIDACIEEAKMNLKKKHKQMAKSCLVKKHQLEKQLEKKASALHNIQNCLQQLEGTHTNAHVWEAYKNALDAFNTTYKTTGISEEAVDDTMLKLGEALEIHEDIQSALGQSPTVEEDTTALEQELEDLMKSDYLDQDQPPPDDNSGRTDDLEKSFAKLSINLPKVPESSPDVSLHEALDYI